MMIPEHLSDEAKAMWERVATEYELTPDALMLLRVALENWDRAQQARELVTRKGLVLNGRRNPAVDIEKQCYSLFMRAMRQLGLDIEEPGPIGRPSGDGLPPPRLPKKKPADAPLFDQAEVN